MNTTEQNHSIILDFETLDTRPSAIITEVGIIAVRRGTFDPIDGRDIRVNVFTQLATGRTHSADTIAWAEKKGTLPDRAHSEIHLAEALRDTVTFIEKYNPYRIWAWGKDFERPLLEDACRQCGIPLPEYQFRKFACGRDHWQTAFGMAEKPPERTHHAYQDVHDELRDILKALRELSSTSAF